VTRFTRTDFFKVALIEPTAGCESCATPGDFVLKAKGCVVLNANLRAGRQSLLFGENFDFKILPLGRPLGHPVGFFKIRFD